MDRFYTITEAAQMLGLGRRTIYDRVRQGRIKAVRLKIYGEPWRIPESELQKLIKNT